MNEYRGLALAIAAVIVIFATFLGALLIVLSWIGITVYAVFKAFADGTGSPDPTGIIISVAMLVTWLVVGLAVIIRLVGRGMEPRKRDRTDDLDAVGL
jgi:small-conductance mechanosensitive channel